MISKRHVNPGTIPLRDFSHDRHDTFLGLIVRVDEVMMKCDVKSFNPPGYYYEVELTQAMAGHRSFWGGIPETNSLVVCGWRWTHKNTKNLVILGYHPVANRTGMRFDPFSATDPSQVFDDERSQHDKFFGKTFRTKRLMLRPGDVGGMSSSGSELVLSKDVRITNRAGDLLELRDAERSLVTQSIHRVHQDGAVHLTSGPIRRAATFLPTGLLGSANSFDPQYAGLDDLQTMGPTNGRYVDSTGKAAGFLNNFASFPPTTLANHRQYHYVGTSQGVAWEDLENGGTVLAYTEHRKEFRHVTSGTQEVLGEIDGFDADRPQRYIEQVFGTIVGNDPNGMPGLLQYGKILKPSVFKTFQDNLAGSFELSEANRAIGGQDESDTLAGAYMFRLNPPSSPFTNAPFVMAVQKQGKVLVSIPGSNQENQKTKNISLEANLAGALKAYVGAANPDRVSIHLTTEGGVVLNIGSDQDGNCITTNYRGAVKSSYEFENPDGVSHSVAVRGNDEMSITGNQKIEVGATYSLNATGAIQLNGSNVTLNALNNYTVNAAAKNLTVSGKTQHQYAESVTEKIATGGFDRTVLLGDHKTTLGAGTHATSVLVGNTEFTNTLGDFKVDIGAGSFGVSIVAGNITMTTLVGNVAMTGTSIGLTSTTTATITAAASIALTAPIVMIGIPATFGVVRGAPMMPPGSPSLDLILGIPLQGSTVILSA